MSTTEDVVAHDVRAYAAQVRAALADLDAEQVDDLTDGLEANLADALADAGRAHGGSLADEFGEPAAYAAELRAAAGLAPAGAPARTEGALRAALLRPWREARAGARALLVRLRATRWWPGAEELLVELRPAWWVVRGWALAHLLLQMVGAEPHAFWVPTTSGGWVLLLLAVVASAQWGRGRWRTGPRWDRVLRVVDGVLALAAFLLLVTLPQAHRDEVGVAEATVVTSVPVDGVWVEGEQARNLFVYDADGNPVEGAQVFDQKGRPVTTEPGGGDRWAQQEYWPDETGESLLHVGVPGVDGRTRWNVFPLHSVPSSVWEEPSAPLDLDDAAVRRSVQAPAWPFAAAAPVRPWTGETLPTPGPTPTPAAEPSTPAGATSDATASPAPTPAPTSDPATSPDAVPQG